MKYTFLIFIVFVMFITNVQAQLCNIRVGIASQKSATCGNCDGAITAYANGTPPYSYSWVGPNGAISTSNPFANACPGAYSVTITDAQNCTGVASTVLAEDIFTGAHWPIGLISTDGDEEIHDMTTDALGNVYAIGTFTRNITFGSVGTFINVLPKIYSIFVVKFDKCGHIDTARVYGSVTTANQYMGEYHIEIIGNEIAVAGEFTEIDFTSGGNTMLATGATDVFTAILDQTTLTATLPTKQVKIYSNYGDNVKGLSVNGHSLWVSGGYDGPNLQISGTSVNLPSSNSGTELFLCRFTNTLSLAWAKNYPGLWSDNGMTMQNVGATIYFTYMKKAFTTMYTWLSSVDYITGNIIATQQVGQLTEFYGITDMTTYNNNLYLCGYKKESNGNKRAAIIYYNDPNVNGFVWSANNTRLSSYTNSVNCVSNKIVANSSGVFVSGNYDHAGFTFYLGSNPSYSIPTVYGTTNHFVYKTDYLLTQSSPNGWNSGAASSTTGTSTGNTLCYDNVNGVYYLGGKFNNTIYFNTPPTLQYLSAIFSFDAFIGRFVDNGYAQFKLLPFTNNTVKDINSNVSIYPNPANNNITIKSLNDDAIKVITITDLTGRVVYSNDCSTDVFEYNTDISFLPASSYFVNITTLNNSYNIKFIVVK